MKRDCDQGFTLLELLISLTILSLALVLLIPSTISILEGSKKFSDKLSAVNQRNKLENLLNKNLSSALSIKADYKDYRGVYFVGRPTIVKYLFPGRNGPEKRTIERDDNGSIIFTRGIFKDEVASFKNTQIKFSYFGKIKPRENKKWHAIWVDNTKLPELIKFWDGRNNPVIVKIWRED